MKAPSAFVLGVIACVVALCAPVKSGAQSIRDSVRQHVGEGLEQNRSERQ